MTSILTNIAAMSALQTLRSINSGMEETQGRVSSGLRVGEAADNAAYWSIATTMRSDNAALGAVSDALGLGAAKVDTAYAGMEASIEVVKEIKTKLVAAREAGVDRNKIQEEISQLQDQLKSIASSASFSGENWLQAKISDGTGNLTDITKQVVGSFVRDASGNVSVKTIDVDLDRNTVLFDEAGNEGILDVVAHYSDTGAVKAFEITTGIPSATSVHVAKVFTKEQLDSFASATTLTHVADTDTGLYVIGAATDAVNNGAYFRIGEDQYVKVMGDGTTATAATTETAQEAAGTVAIGVDDDGNKVYLATGTGATAADGQIATKLSYSVSDLDLTSDLTGIAGLSAEENLDVMIQFVDTQLEAMTSAAADLGSVSMRLDLQEDFVNKLSDSIDSGIGRLVDADMNEESTRLKALQTQQQLGIQALSIANTSSENILSLFR